MIYIPVFSRSTIHQYALNLISIPTFSPLLCTPKALLFSSGLPIVPKLRAGHPRTGFAQPIVHICRRRARHRVPCAGGRCERVAVDDPALDECAVRSDLVALPGDVWLGLRACGHIRKLTLD